MRTHCKTATEQRLWQRYLKWEAKAEKHTDSELRRYAWTEANKVYAKYCQAAGIVNPNEEGEEDEWK